MGRNARVWFALLLLAGLGLCGISAQAAPKMEAALDRNDISLGDSAVLTITFEGCEPSSDPSLPTIANLQYGGQSRLDSTFINGSSVVQRVTYSFEVHPTKEGVYSIPSIQENVDGANLATHPVTLRVRKGGPAPTAGENEIAFLRIVPETNVLYFGQVLPVEVQCYCQDRVAQIQLPQLTSDNFIVAELPGGHQQATKVQVGNIVYNRFTFATSVTAIKTGAFPLGPATWSMLVMGGQRDIFGRYTESRQASFTSDSPTIRVLGVPARGAPPSFSGALGQFTLEQYDAGPTTVSVGDPVTLKIRIGGEGAFDTVALPTNNSAEWREFKIYPPTSKFDASDSLQVRGSKYFEQVIVPQNAEVKEIPPFNFSYFDPSHGDFRTLTHAAIPLTVHAAATASVPVLPGTASAETSDQNQDIVHIKPMLGVVQSGGPVLVERPGFLALQAIAPLAWICALARRKYKENLANNPRLRRQRQVAELVRQGLADLNRPGVGGDPEKFYTTVLHLLQEQLGERLDLPAPAITEAVIDDLPADRLRAETPAVLHELFQACNQFRYAPERAGQAVDEMLPKVKSVLEDLRKMPASPARTGFPQSVGIILLLLAGATTLRAQSAADIFTQANRLYEEGKYAQAAGTYQKLAQDGTVSTAVLFNLGNSYLKAGQVGRAIFSYREAEALAPRDPDVRANLQVARTQAGVNYSAVPGSRWTRWVEHLSVNEWTAVTSAVAAFFFLVLTARELFPAFRGTGVTLAVLAGLASLGLVICLTLSLNFSLWQKSLVVVTPEAVVRLGPLPESQSVFTVRDGAELLVLGSDGDWLQVSDANHHTGWLRRGDAEIIP